MTEPISKTDDDTERLFDEIYALLDDVLGVPQSEREAFHKRRKERMAELRGYGSLEDGIIHD